MLLAVLLACNDAERVDEQLVDVGCAMCIYQQEGAVGCYWAAEIDGEPWVVVGDTPEDHMDHGPEGICNVERVAKVSGELRDERFYVQSFELQPIETPTRTPHTAMHHEH